MGFFGVFVSVLLHTATANGFQMVTSGAQSKAINDWLIPSVEVSCVWIQTGNIDEVTSFIGTLSGIWSDRASQGILSQVSEVLTAEARADSAGKQRSGCPCTGT